jgi:hypothetical protein
MADERDQCADLAVAERNRPPRQDSLRPDGPDRHEVQGPEGRPSADATRTDLAQKALDALGSGTDTKGASFAKQTITLKEGGN